LTSVKGVAYTMDAIKIFEELFINNIFVILMVVAFLWISALATCFIVYYLLQCIEKVSKRLTKNTKQSEKDFLTGLNNTKNFTRLFNQAIENVSKKKDSISVLVIDIDFFKKVNDVYGSLAGDSILRSLSDILIGACGKSDVLSRIERDKFSMILYKTSNNEACEIAESIRAVIEKYPFMLPKGKIIYITVSIGVATYPDTTEEPKAVFSQADKSLHHAKQTGKNKVCSI
jgi:diguanylate cyclase (GGDEF) domain